MPRSLKTPLPHPRDPWDARFGFFWYNDQEVFHDTQADLDLKAEAIAQSGINHVITFSCTHFRWSFHAQWPLLTETLAKIVRACHRYGIYVTEHHSTHLTFNPANEEEEVWTDQVFAARASKRESWGLTRGHTDADPIAIDGVRLSALRQIDGRTGLSARSRYRGWCHCFNNPDYRRAYLAYLETLYATGIDGIMTDDVQWFGDGHACACPHCRRLFREQYGAERCPVELGRLLGLPPVRVKEDGEEIETLALGQGKLALVPLDWNQHQINREYQVYRLEAGRREPYTPPTPADEAARDRLVAYLAGLLPGGPDLIAENLPQGVIATLFQSEDGESLVVHLLNAAGTLDAPAEGTIAHTDRIPFPSHVGKPEATLHLKRAQRSRRPLSSGSATLYRLGHAPANVHCDEADDDIVLRLDPAWMDDYALIEI